MCVQGSADVGSYQKVKYEIMEGVENWKTVLIGHLLDL